MQELNGYCIIDEKGVTYFGEDFPIQELNMTCAPKYMMFTTGCIVIIMKIQGARCNEVINVSEAV